MSIDTRLVWGLRELLCERSSGHLRFRGLLFRAEDPFQHGGVPGGLHFDDPPVTESEHIGLVGRLPTGGDSGEHDHDLVVVGEKTSH
ncbi:hypothetical protein ACFWAY_46295 [Rhodococcus sp. NPDC059968]|uniref:hypothetical protein n=1 Tax=Rhodococcus sp. NPDC059968 TaxID=3347017 RepID=UPI003670796A